MATLCKLTAMDGKPFYVNPELVSAVIETDRHVKVHTNGEAFRVRETLPQVLGLVTPAATKKA